MRTIAPGALLAHLLAKQHLAPGWLERCATVGEFWFGDPVPVLEYAAMTPLAEGRSRHATARRRGSPLTGRSAAA